MLHLCVELLLDTLLVLETEEECNATLIRKISYRIGNPICINYNLLRIKERELL